MSNDNVHRLTHDGKEIILIGTAHVSKESVQLVKEVIEEEKPDTVCLEICQSRYQSIAQREQWQNTDLFKVIREKKASLLLLNLMLAHFQKKIGQKLGIRPGEEIIQGMQSAERVGADIHLADRDIRTTLLRALRIMGLWTKARLLASLLTSSKELDAIREEDIEKMKRQDVLETVLSEIGESFPEIRRVLIDERDQYIAYKTRNAPGHKIVAVVGAGHVPGIEKYWHQPIDIDLLEQLPPKGRLLKWLKWIIPGLIVGLMLFGFHHAGPSAGTFMIKWWVIANSLFAGLGAAVALGHPLTILSAIVASPLTSLNPMIAAGWVSGLVEAFLGKPKVKDFERLPDDITNVRGFWRNKISRILLVVVFTNVGSSLGTFVAIPLMVKVFE
jgi:pheromone shutdown-related protein TraB